MSTTTYYYYLGECAQLDVGPWLRVRHRARQRVDVQLHHLRRLDRARVGQGEGELQRVRGADGGGREAEVTVLEGRVAQAVAEGKGHGAAGEVAVADAEPLAVDHLPAGA